MQTEQAFQVERIRKDFPILRRQMNGKPLVYLDNAATTQKPLPVIRRMADFYEREYATVHRGVYALSQDSTIECEQVRARCQKFLNAADVSQIIFVRGATEAINLVATAYGEKFFKAGDEIVITEMEHHANFVPWQMLCRKKGLTLKVAPITDAGELDLDAYQKLLGPRTRMVAVTHVSNVLGTINPLREIIRLAHAAGAAVLVDGAQAAPHLRVDVQELDCDFYCFSGHKLYGPTGIGIFYGKKEHLDAMDPYQFGGDMIESVSVQGTTFAKPPLKFEAGTPAITQIVGLGTAMDYLERVGYEDIARHEESLLAYATEKLRALPDVRIIGTAQEKISVIAFMMERVHAHDIGTVLDQEGIAIRAGHHCAQPLMQRFRLAATARASFAFYNTREEIDQLIRGLEKVRRIFR